MGIIVRAWRQAMYTLRPYRTAYLRDAFSPVQIPAFKSLLYCLSQGNQQKRDQQHRTEPEVGPTAENLLVVQAKGESSRRLPLEGK